MSTGAAYRVYERLEKSGGKRFVGVVVHLATNGDEVQFRWAASRLVRTVPVKVWDQWVREPFPAFVERLRPAT